MTDSELATFGHRLQDRIAAGSKAEVSSLSEIRTRLAAVLSSDKAETETPEQLTEAMEEQIESLRDEIELYLELAQLGMAVGVVQHDFGDAIRTIRSNIRALQPWAKANKDLAALHASLRTAFEHLDGYLTLFTPLNRRLYRTSIMILGENIAHFLDGIFAERLKDTDTYLVATDSFRNREIEGYPSTFFPVFVNLVENARYWVEEGGARPGRIVLDTDGKDFLVTDTGPGVSDRDREAIFDYGFTRKKAGGQGLGLFISRQVLKRAGWELLLDPPVEGRGATFRMVPPSEETGDTEQSSDPVERTT
jgi:signal transduction histidine kinase